jgi:GT2 family glycosyltransferase
VSNGSEEHLSWVMLTMGDRPGLLTVAMQSVGSSCSSRTEPGHSEHHVRDDVVIIANGCGLDDLPHDLDAVVVGSPRNVGVPGGRDLGVRATQSSLVGFLDDDASIATSTAAVPRAFIDNPDLGAVSFRLVDEHGETSTRHVPRPGGRNPDQSGPVATFLGGACAIRRSAYDQVGGYFCDLFYGHEEVELSWRLIDAGWQIRYLADVQVFHPRTEIGRHEHGWHLTGRNRVWIARRTLPWPVAIAHVTIWLVLGVIRAPDASCRRSYLSGWWEGWRTRWADGSPRRPITWRGVWRLTRLGRPPVI